METRPKVPWFDNLLAMKTLAVMFFSTLAVCGQSFEVVAAKDIMIPMRDGIRLCTHIYRPARNGAPVQEKFPITLSALPMERFPGAVQRACNNPFFLDVCPLGAGHRKP